MAFKENQDIPTKAPITTNRSNTLETKLRNEFVTPKYLTYGVVMSMEALEGVSSKFMDRQPSYW